MRYADIVLPLAQPLYTFAVAEGVTLCEGMAVVVPFGRSKIYTGIVWRLHDRRPDFKTVKTVSRVLYGTPLLDERQRRFWEWVADYYMCTLGEVMRVALPSLMKPSGHGEEEFAADEFRPRREWFVALAGEALTADGLAAALERMGRRAPRQREALEELAALAPDGAEVARSRLAADRTALALLVKKGLLTCIEREVAPGPVTGGAQFRLPTLSAAQRKAAEEIRAVFADRATVLHFAAEVLARGGQVLLLVPEIALTAQLVDRLRQVFGERVIAYHSKLTDRKRTELYLRLRDSAGGELVIGARSAIFLPLRRLELVVVDEEHDPSYKQTDPAPRYQARDCAVLMTRLPYAAGQRYSVAGELFKRCDRKIRQRGTGRALRTVADAADPRVRYDPCRETRRAACPFQQIAARPYGGDPRRRRSGDAFPEPAGFRTLCRVPGVRLDGPLSGL